MILRRKNLKGTDKTKLHVQEGNLFMCNVETKS